jgi:hypothetical protein
VSGRWIFDSAVASEICALDFGISQLSDLEHQRLFRVLLGGILVELSNVRISGKGRRYRNGWHQRTVDPTQVGLSFIDACHSAILDIHKFSRRRCNTFEIMRGDCRNQIRGLDSFDLAVFSPPYPNSFDYTDVYNIELWTLGYLEHADHNRELRISTLSSHVQLNRVFLPPPHGSRSLDVVLRSLENKRSELWSKHIPEMIGAYFSDIVTVLEAICSKLVTSGKVWMVVGDSQYAGIRIPVSTIIQDLASEIGFTVQRHEAFRSMRLSPQQGGREALAETLLVLRKN